MREIVHSETCSIQSIAIAWSSEVAAVGAVVPQMKTRGTSVYSDWGTNYSTGFSIGVIGVGCSYGGSVS